MNVINRIHQDEIYFVARKQPDGELKIVSGPHFNYNDAFMARGRLDSRLEYKIVVSAMKFLEVQE